jgi:hypothetical protein
VVRSVHVYDNDGECLGSFATWATAHDWAHFQIAVGSMAAPLEIEDRRSRTTRRVWADRCVFGGTALDVDDPGERCGVGLDGPGGGPTGEPAAARSFAGPPAPRRPTA